MLFPELTHPEFYTQEKGGLLERGFLHPGYGDSGGSPSLPAPPCLPQHGTPPPPPTEVNVRGCQRARSRVEGGKRFQRSHTLYLGDDGAPRQANPPGSACPDHQPPGFQACPVQTARCRDPWGLLLVSDSRCTTDPTLRGRSQQHTEGMWGNRVWQWGRLDTRGRLFLARRQLCQI